ncbi:hypothetical protein AB0F17_23450 [Nonomuraea sp. NPDC026600]|uniref:hypothetical protein n=1 Tax=Nonomuraea sp. NPDC026600 TaxID=3155363 RepID=UPI0033DE0096
MKRERRHPAEVAGDRLRHDLEKWPDFCQNPGRDKASGIRFLLQRESLPIWRISGVLITVN